MIIILLYSCFQKYKKAGNMFKYTNNLLFQQWRFYINYGDEPQELSCVVERPSSGSKATSYLFFQEYKMEVSGPNVKLIEGQAYVSIMKPMVSTLLSIQTDMAI